MLAVKKQTLIKLAVWGIILSLLCTWALPHGTENVYAASSDFTILKEKWRSFYLGDETLDPDDGAVNLAITQIETAGKNARNQMNRGSGITILFGNTFPTATSEMRSQYNRLRRMAVMYGTYGSELYHDDALKDDILFGLEWLYNNLYGTKEMENKGWRNINLHNWWDWYVGVPNDLIMILLALEPEMSRSAIDKYLAPVFYFYDKWYTDPNSATAIGHRIDAQCILAAILAENETRLNRYLGDIPKIIQRVQSGDGLQEDYMYIWHSNIPYTGTYGVIVLLGFPLDVICVHAGTRFEPSFPKNEIIKYIKNAYEPLIYNGKMMSMVQGRVIVRGDVELSYGTNSFTKALVGLIGVFGYEEDIYLKQLIRHTVKGKNENAIKAALPFSYMSMFDEAMEDTSISEYNPQFSRVYYTGDRVVQQRNGYAVGISMSSSRIAKYEDYGENKKGWYTGDGMLYLYNDNAEDANPYGRDFWSNVNWHRLPGTTEDATKRQDGQGDPASTQDFVGGVEFEGEFSVAAMFTQSSNRTLDAQKSWFLFDDEVVALGAGIKSTSSSPVYTFVENRVLRAGTKVYAAQDIMQGGELMPATKGYEKSYENPSWANVSGTGGYYFPGGGNLTMRNSTTTPSLLEMWFAHGTNPQDESYSYVLLPDKTAVETAKYALNPDITVLANTDKVQAVRENKRGITGMVFWVGGKYGDITASSPLIVMVREDEGEYVVSFSDPTQKLNEATITIDKLVDFSDWDEGITVSHTKTSTIIKANLSGSKGKTFTARQKYRVPAEVLTAGTVTVEYEVVSAEPDESRQNAYIIMGLYEGERLLDITLTPVNVGVRGIHRGSIYVSDPVGKKVKAFLMSKGSIVPLAASGELYSAE